MSLHHMMFCDCCQYYRCILLVPDIYNRQHAKELVSMLLVNMGFSGISRVILSGQPPFHKTVQSSNFSPPCVFVCTAIIVHQESVCATFGSGLSSACVVDVGDQKTSLCCVEDGVSHRNSRSGYLLRKFVLWEFDCTNARLDKLKMCQSQVLVYLFSTLVTAVPERV